MATITDAQRKEFFKAAHESNKAEADILRYLVNNGVGQITVEQFEEVMLWANTPAELPKDEEGRCCDCRCSFCNERGGRLIASPKQDHPQTHICSSCVEVCQSILDDDRATATPQPFLVQ
jgi:hypothetical protein